MKTTIQIDTAIKDKLSFIGEKYHVISYNRIIEFILNYLERNEINLKYEVRNEMYYNLKRFDENILDTIKELFKSEERVYKTLKNQEKNYLKNISHDGYDKIKNEISKTKIEKSIVMDFYNKITIEESKVTGKKIFILNISEEEFHDFLKKLD